MTNQQQQQHTFYENDWVRRVTGTRRKNDLNKGLGGREVNEKNGKKPDDMVRMDYQRDYQREQRQ